MSDRNMVMLYYRQDLEADITAYDRAASDYLVKGNADVSNVFRQIAHELRRQLAHLKELEDRYDG